MALLVLVSQAALMIFIAAAPYLDDQQMDFSLWPIIWYKAIGLLLNILGATLLLVAVRTMNKNFEIRAQQRQTSKLVTTGIFSKTRNPVYVAGLLLCFGWSLSFCSWWAGLASCLLIVILSLKIRYEEFFLQNQFGDEYSLYCQKVPRWF